MTYASGAALRSRVADVVAAGDVLWSAGAEARAVWLGEAFQALRRRVAERAEFSEELAHSSGLSVAMVHWAVESTLAAFQADSLSALYASVPLPRPHTRLARAGQLCAVVLAGNVFTAAARAIAVPLLFGIPVIAKPSSDDDAFVRALFTALEQSAPELARAFACISMPSEERDQWQPLFEQADIVSVYGSDDTVNTIRAQLSATVSFVAHGHGLGAAFVDRGALRDEASARAAAQALALDVAAYDQRGCLSPLAAWVVAGQPISPEDFARLSYEALGALRERLPRGPLPLHRAGAQLSFRGIAALRGTVFEGDGYAVCYEGRSTLRLAPGYRNLQVLDVRDARELGQKLAPLGVHLKCLGVAGVEDRAALGAALPARLAPRVCPLGSMQTPPLNALQDGVPVWEGLLRYVQDDL